MVDAPAMVLESALYADDLDAAEAFYAGRLGLEVITRGPGRHVFFRCGAGVVLVFNPAATEVSDPRSPLAVPTHGARGRGHLCFAAEPLGIERWRDRLGEACVPIEAEVSWPNGARSLYFRDPAGNSLEIAEARLWERG
jgi:catechol 2,3-dioxygenase-like lactoylglutathione lyase family enzyme